VCSRWPVALAVSVAAAGYPVRAGAIALVGRRRGPGGPAQPGGVESLPAEGVLGVRAPREGGVAARRGGPRLAAVDFRGGKPGGGRRAAGQARRGAGVVPPGRGAAGPAAAAARARAHPGRPGDPPEGPWRGRGQPAGLPASPRRAGAGGLGLAFADALAQGYDWEDLSAAYQRLSGLGDRTRGSGDPKRTARALWDLGWMQRGDKGVELFEEARAILVSAGDAWHCRWRTTTSAPSCSRLTA